MWRRIFGVSHPEWHQVHGHWHETNHWSSPDHLGMACSVLLPWEPSQRHWRSVLLQVTAWRWSQRHVLPARWCWPCFSQLSSSLPSLLQVNVEVLVSQVMSLRYFGLLHLWQIYFHVPGEDKAHPSFSGRRTFQSSLSTEEQTHPHGVGADVI